MRVGLSKSLDDQIYPLKISLVEVANQMTDFNFEGIPTLALYYGLWDLEYKIKKNILNLFLNL